MPGLTREDFYRNFTYQLQYHPSRFKQKIFQFKAFYESPTRDASTSYDPTILRKLFAELNTLGFFVTVKSNTSNTIVQLIVYKHPVSAHMQEMLNEDLSNEQRCLLTAYVSLLDQKFPVLPQKFSAGFSLDAAKIAGAHSFAAALSACIMPENGCIDTLKRMQLLQNYVLNQSASAEENNPSYLNRGCSSSLILTASTWYRTRSEVYPRQSYDAIGVLDPTKIVVLLQCYDESGRWRGVALPGGKVYSQTSSFEENREATVANVMKNFNEINDFNISNFSEAEMATMASVYCRLLDTRSITHKNIYNDSTLKKLVNEGYLDESVKEFYEEVSNYEMAQHTVESLELVEYNILSLFLSERRLGEMISNDQKRSCLVGGFQVIVVSLLDVLYPQDYVDLHEFYVMLIFFYKELGYDKALFKQYALQACNRVMQAMLADILASRFPVQIQLEWSAEKIFSEWSSLINIDFFNFFELYPGVNQVEYADSLGMVLDELYTFNKLIQAECEKYKSNLIVLIEEYKSCITTDKRVLNMIHGVATVKSVITEIPRLSVMTRAPALLEDPIDMDVYTENDQILIPFDVRGKHISVNVYAKRTLDKLQESPYTRVSFTRKKHFRWHALEAYVADQSEQNRDCLIRDPITGYVMQDPVLMASYIRKNMHVLICNRSTAMVLSAKAKSQYLRTNNKKYIVQARFDVLRDFIQMQPGVLVLSMAAHDSMNDLLNRLISPSFVSDQLVQATRHCVMTPACEVVVRHVDDPLSAQNKHLIELGHHLFISKLPTNTILSAPITEKVRIHFAKKTSVGMGVSSIIVLRKHVLGRDDIVIRPMLAAIIVTHGGMALAQHIVPAKMRDTQRLCWVLQFRSDAQQFDLGFDVKTAQIDDLASLFAALSACVSDQKKRRAVINQHVLQKNTHGCVVNAKNVEVFSVSTIIITTRQTYLTAIRCDQGGLPEVTIENDVINRLPADLKVLVLEQFTEDGRFDGLVLPGGAHKVETKLKAGMRCAEYMLTLCARGNVKLSDEQQTKLDLLATAIPDYNNLIKVMPSADLATALPISERLKRYYSEPVSAHLSKRTSHHSLHLIMNNSYHLEVDQSEFAQLVPNDVDVSAPGSLGYSYRARIRPLHNLLSPRQWHHRHEYYTGILPLLSRMLSGVENDFIEYLKHTTSVEVNWMYELIIGGDDGHVIFPAQINPAWSSAEIFTTWRSLVMIDPIAFCEDYSVDLDVYASWLNMSAYELVSLTRELKAIFDANRTSLESIIELNALIVRRDPSLIITESDHELRIADEVFEQRIKRMLAQRVQVTAADVTDAEIVPAGVVTFDENGYATGFVKQQTASVIHTQGLFGDNSHYVRSPEANGRKSSYISVV